MAQRSHGRGWLEQPLQLRPGVEQLCGANDEPMLFLPDQGRYLRLSTSGAKVVRLLDGAVTGTQLLDRARAGRPTSSTEPSPLMRFLEELRDAGALTAPAVATVGRRRLVRSGLRRRALRVPLLRNLGPLVRLPGRLLAALPVWAWIAFATAVALAAASSATMAMLSVPGTHGVYWLAIPTMMLVEVTAHELAHATVCEALGVRVREAGLSFWCFIVPIAYVDRTDAYRVRCRSGRVAIALAGPVVDLVAACAAACVALTASGRVAATAYLLLAVQLLLVANNLNPFLPTDGYHALEAATGELNVRRRAFAYSAHRLLRMPLPTSLHGLSIRRRRSYLAYSLISLGFSGVVLAVAILVGISVAGAID